MDDLAKDFRYNTHTYMILYGGAMLVPIKGIWMTSRHPYIV